MLSADKQAKLTAFCIHRISPSFQAEAACMYFQSAILLVRITTVWELFGISSLRGVLGGGNSGSKTFPAGSMYHLCAYNKENANVETILVISEH